MNDDKSPIRRISIVADARNRKLVPVSLTKAHFLDAYSKGKWNLSTVPCPPCMESVGLMYPPECYNEAIRRRAVESYRDLPQWRDKIQFKKIILESLKYFSVSGVSISIIDQGKQLVKAEHQFGISECPRKISLDGHAILSQGYFVLLDATKDWRTFNTPFVKGVPNIKFYAGVPLITKTNQIIGILAIFDSFPKGEFKEANINTLQNYSKMVMNILESPPEKKNFYEPNISLAKKLGRATSRGQIMSVFEKDGSGSAYSQNHIFRFSKKDSKNDSNFNHSLWKSIYQVGNLKAAALVLSKFLSEKFKADFVYIMEIRIGEPFNISNEFFPKENKIEAENYRFANKLERSPGESEVMTRIIGSYGDVSENVTLENELHYSAFISEFGIHYYSSQFAKLNSGLIMPFYRNSPKLVRKQKLPKCESQNSSKSDDLSIDLFLRSGGFQVALFNEQTKTFTDPEISDILSNTALLRKIYINT